MNDNSQDKKSLRAQKLAERKLISAEKTAQAAQMLAKNLLDYISDSQAIIAGYRAIHNEIDVAPAMVLLQKRGNTLCLPVVVKDEKPLEFRAWNPGENLVYGHYDVQIPTENVPLVLPDIILVPLVAFDGQLNRLGYGAGHYDATAKWLRSIKKLQLIGVAYSTQRVDEIPVEAHDAKLDAIITEKGLV